eukprot:GSMAST32.ASY1.ANO1.132.1 assembled CDS
MAKVVQSRETKTIQALDIRARASSDPLDYTPTFLRHSSKNRDQKTIVVSDIHNSSNGSEIMGFSPDEKVNLRSKIALGIGEAAQTIWVLVAGFYLNIFLLETLCMSTSTVGIFQLCGGIWDTINDPCIGILSDKTNTRFGRRRPWLLGAAIPAGFSYFCIWIGPDMGETSLFAYCLTCYMLISASITSIQVQISSQLTRDYDERTELAMWRLGIGNVLGLIAVFLHSLIVQAYPESSKLDGFRISGFVMGTAISCFALFAFFNIKEKFDISTESKDEIPFLVGLRHVFSNFAFICVEGVYLFGLTAVVIVQTNLVLFCKYILEDESQVSYLILLVQGMAMLSLPFWNWFSQKYNKKIMYHVGSLVVAISLGMMFLIDKGDIIFGYFIAGALGFCLTVVYLVPYAMLPDVIEEDELRTGKRREGIYCGFFVVFMKLSVTGSLALSNFVLGISGYKSPTALSTEFLETQKDSVLLAIRLMISPVAIVFLIGANICVRNYPITRESHAKSVELVKARKQHASQEKTNIKTMRSLGAIDGLNTLGETKCSTQHIGFGKLPVAVNDVGIRIHGDIEFGKLPVAVNDVGIRLHGDIEDHDERDNVNDNDIEN